MFFAAIGCRWIQGICERRHCWLVGHTKRERHSRLADCRHR